MNKILIYPVLLILVMLSSCGKERAKARDGVLSEKVMVELLVDTHLADAILFTDLSSTEAKRDKARFYYASVLEKHGITKARMDSSVTWYMKHPAAYSRVYQQVVRDLEKLQGAVKKNDKTE